jgi:hypothetical protein
LVPARSNKATVPFSNCTHNLKVRQTTSKSFRFPLPTMTASTPENVSERHMRKRIAARMRQQRCRARKREAKMAKNRELINDSRRSPQGLSVNVLVSTMHPQQKPRMPTFHLPVQPMSPFVLYPRQNSVYSPPGSRPVWPVGNQVLGFSSPTTSQIAQVSPLGCKTTASQRLQTLLPIARVSPVLENNKVPFLPELDRLERIEETAIDAMLSLRRSGPTPADTTPAFRIAPRKVPSP